MGQPLDEQALHARFWPVFLPDRSLNGLQVFCVFAGDDYFFRPQSMPPGVHSRACLATTRVGAGASPCIRAVGSSVSLEVTKYQLLKQRLLSEYPQSDD